MSNNNKHTGFEVPDNYFSELEEQLMSQLKEHQIPKDTGFKIPEGYFEDLEDTILLQNITSKNQSNVISFVPKKMFWYAASIAACFIVFISIKNASSNSTNFNELEIASITAYIEEENVPLETLNLASFINEEDFKSYENEEATFTEYELENYLIENTHDTNFYTE